MEARPILITPETSVITAVNKALQEQLAVLTTNAVAIPAVRTGFAVLVPDIATAVKVSDRISRARDNSNPNPNPNPNPTPTPTLTPTLTLMLTLTLTLT